MKQDNSIRPSSLKKATLNDIKILIEEVFSSEFKGQITDILLEVSCDFLNRWVSRSKMIIFELFNPEIKTDPKINEIIQLQIENLTEYFYKIKKILIKITTDFKKNDKKSNIFKQLCRNHCKFEIEEYIHTCKSSLITYRDDSMEIKYVICPECKIVYTPDCLVLLCVSCNKSFCTQVVTNKKDTFFQLATWDMNHCTEDLLKPIKCTICKGELHLNLKDPNFLYCQKCNSFINSQFIQNECKTCKMQYPANLTIFNRLEYKQYRNKIRDIINLKKSGKPSKNICGCESEGRTFSHLNCGGIPYSGVYKGRNKTVCGDCSLMSDTEEFLWVCSKCNQTSKIPTKIKSAKSESKNEIMDFQIKKRNSSNLISNNAILKKIGNLKEEISTTPREKISSKISTPVKSVTKFEDSEFTKNLEVLELDRKCSEKLIKNTQKKNLIASEPQAMDKPYNYIKRHQSGKIFHTDIKGSNPSSMRNLSLMFNEFDENEKNGIKLQSKPGIIQLSNRDLHENFKTNNCETSAGTSNENTNEFIPKIAPKAINSSGKGIINENEQNEEKEIIKVRMKPNSSKTINLIKNQELELGGFLIEDYKLTRRLGEGSYGNIYLAENIKTKEKFAIKKLIVHDQEELKLFSNEFNLVSEYRHKNILQLFGINVKKFDFSTMALYILMERAISDWEMDIINRSKKNNFYSERDLITILKQITSALVFLQRKGVAHRDIKPQNILVFDGFNFKVADFGEAKFKEIRSISQDTLRGTELYMSPILFNTLKLGKKNFVAHNIFKSDVFSLGYCLIYAASLSMKVLVEIRKLTNMQDIVEIIKKYLQNRYSSNIIDVFTSMIQVDELRRCDFEGLMKIVENL